ncbi:MAG: aminopeptidase P family N-terminal domain-containing protein, partial [Candidatus Acidiferrales bacterium]
MNRKTSRSNLKELGVGYPLDQKKWERVRQMMAQHDLDALVVRAPDNILYLTNYWTMKGYDIAIFPREGDPTLLVIEPQYQEARRTAWNKDVRFFSFYHPQDPRPPMSRSLDQCLDVLRERKLGGRVGVELSQLAQICDRMVGEPSLYTQGYFDAFRGFAKQVVDTTPLLAEVRA